MKTEEICKRKWEQHRILVSRRKSRNKKNSNTFNQFFHSRCQRDRESFKIIFGNLMSGHFDNSIFDWFFPALIFNFV